MPLALPVMSNVGPPESPKQVPPLAPRAPAWLNITAMSRNPYAPRKLISRRSALRRVCVGPFHESALVPLDAVRAAFEAGGPEACDALLMPVETALGELIELPMQREAASRIMRGQAVLLRGRQAPVAGAAYATEAGRLLAVGEIEQGAFHPRRVFQL